MAQLSAEELGQVLKTVEEQKILIDQLRSEISELCTANSTREESTAAEANQENQESDEGENKGPSTSALPPEGHGRAWTNPETAAASWRAAPGTQTVNTGMKLQNFKTGGDIEVFLDRFDVFCDGINMPESKKASCLLSALDDVTFRIVNKELHENDRRNVNKIKAHMCKRFTPPHGMGNCVCCFVTVSKSQKKICRASTQSC